MGIDEIKDAVKNLPADKVEALKKDLYLGTKEKGVLDSIQEKLVSRKLLVFGVSTALLMYAGLDADIWGMIAMCYIGGQTAIDFCKGLAWLMEALVKIKDAFVKYWKLVVGTVTGVFIFFLGILAASKDRSKEKVKLSDAEASAKASSKITQEERALFEKWIEKDIQLKRKKEKEKAEIEKNKVNRVKELENDPEKLDKILEEEFSLKKGE